MPVEDPVEVAPPLAEKRAWKPSGRKAGGDAPRSARGPGGRSARRAPPPAASRARGRCATTCCSAWTPVSVRPAACRRSVSPEKAFTARSIEPCTGRQLGLGLEALVGAAVVFEVEPVARHQPSRVPARGGSRAGSRRASCAPRPSRWARSMRTAPVAAGDQQPVVQHLARRALAVLDARQQRLDPHRPALGWRLEPGAGERREAADAGGRPRRRAWSSRSGSRAAGSSWRR